MQKKQNITAAFFLVFILSHSISWAQKKNAQIKIDNRETYQKVIGFGGFGFSPQFAPVLSDSEVDMMWGKGAAQLGYNIMRAPVYTDSNTWKNILPTVKRAKQNGAIVFGSPWSAPVAYKSNNNIVGGYVLEQYYGAYAQWLNRFVLFMRRNGVEIDAISIQNEPDYAPSYASTDWNGKQFINFLTNHRDSISTKVIAPESLAFRRSLGDSILNNTAACAKLDIFGGHLYGGMAGLNYPLAQQKNKEIWMTEFLINERQNVHKINIDWKHDAFEFAKCIITSMNSNMNAWVHYASKRYYGMLGDGEFGTSNGVVTKRGYILSHFAKYVTGKKRIKHILPYANGLYASAYQSVSGDSIIVMLINQSDNSYDLRFDLPFKTNKYKLVLTDSTKNMVSSNTDIPETDIPTIAVAASSVNTYIFIKSAERDVPQDADPVYTFKDNFESYGGYDRFPDGWINKEGTSIRYAGTYTYGPRIFFFRPESILPAGLYIRTSGSSSLGTAIYGSENNYKLHLDTGSYRLTYSGVGWKAAQKITCSVLTSTSSVVVTKTLTLTNNLNGVSGWSVDVNEITTPDTLDFKVTQAGYYQLQWQLMYQSSFAEAVFGNVKLVKKESVPVQSVTVSSADDKNTINVGQTLQMTAVVLPQNASITACTWSISPTALASIDSNGKLTAKASGKVTVTAKAKDGSAVSGSMDITIAPLTSTVPADTREIVVYPNPAMNGNFTIQGIERIKKIEIINMNGEKVAEYNNLKQATKDIHVNTNTGFIMLKLFDGQKSVYKKVVIQDKFR